MGYFAIDRSPELKHYGILGMKWGIRKQRNQGDTKKPKRRFKLSDKTKHIIKSTAPLALTAGALGAGAIVTRANILPRNKSITKMIRNGAYVTPTARKLLKASRGLTAGAVITGALGAASARGAAVSYDRHHRVLPYVNGHAGTKEDPIRIKFNSNDEKDTKRARYEASQYMKKGYAVKFNNDSPKNSFFEPWEYSPHREKKTRR